MISGLSYKITRVLDSNIVLSHKIYDLLARFPYFLPHDPTFYACQLFTRNKVILDVGANNGISALSFYRLFPKSRIISLEPNPLHKASLVRIQSRYPRFSFRLLGVGEKEEVATFYLPYLGSNLIHTAVSRDLAFTKRQLSSIGVNVEDARFERFESKVAPIDGMNIKPDIIKIDCGGHEVSVLHGAKKTISESRPMILLEYPSALLDQLQKDRFGELVRELDYQAFSYDRPTHSLLPFSESAFKSGTGCRNLVLVHADDL